jgi:hypothetical protein
MKKTIIGLCLLCGVSAANAENWVREVDVPHPIYIDFDSLRINSQSVSYIQKETFSQQANTRLPPKYEKIFFNQVVSQKVVNCPLMIVTQVETLFLDEGGNVVGDDTRVGANRNPVGPDSWAYSVLKNICSSKGVG